MSRPAGPKPKTYGDRQTLKEAFDRLGLWSRIRGGMLREAIMDDQPAYHPAGGRKQIVKHYDGDRHVATTHRVVDAQGQLVHWDEKDCILSDGTKLIRKD